MKTRSVKSDSGALIFMIIALVAGTGLVVYKITESNSISRDSSLRSEIREADRHRFENASYEAKRFERQSEEGQNSVDDKKGEEMLREAKERAEKYNTGAPK